ncbi:LOW QUALITY PROTEIN: ATIC isoform 4 [Pongo abelii]|uniref:ATIC isoform 4 n=1 Tax=Pongo abelii TaxID=9601 RepID=A0A2J8STT1_PONAB|nr:LOW QUALITY PROTEIN: ATIC isoform 4 [Pongo abelii]
MAPGHLGEALAERRGLRPRLGPGTAGAALRD